MDAHINNNHIKDVYLICMMTFGRSVPPPSLAFKMQLCSQRIEIEKNTSKEGERSVQIVHGSEAWW